MREVTGQAKMTDMIQMLSEIRANAVWVGPFDTAAANREKLVGRLDALAVGITSLCETIDHALARGVWDIGEESGRIKLWAIKELSEAISDFPEGGGRC